MKIQLLNDYLAFIQEVSIKYNDPKILLETSQIINKLQQEIEELNYLSNMWKNAHNIIAKQYYSNLGQCD